MNIKAFLAVCIYALPLAAMAQNNCKDVLVQANKNFESGNFSAVVQQLKPCISGLNHEEKFESYRLLTLSHIYLNEKMAADSTMRLMLLKKPTYRTFPNPNEPIEFMQVLRSFEVSPKLLAGIKAGINYTNVFVTANYVPAQTRSVYEPVLGQHFGVTSDYIFSKKLSLRAEAVYGRWNYTRTLDDVAGWKQVYTENLNIFSIPLMLKYAPLAISNKTGRTYFSRISPFIQAGYAFNYLNTAEAALKATDNTYGNQTLSTTNPIERRNRVLSTIVAGGGLSYSTPYAVFFADAVYGFGLNQFVNGSKRYDDEEFIFNNQYLDDDLRLDNFSINFGVSLPLVYRVKKVQK